jgi:hypothetical protein
LEVPKPWALILLLATNVFSQNCLKYGAPISISGKLVEKDRAGYYQFIALRPATPICTMINPTEAPTPNDQYYRKRTGVAEMQAAVYGDDPSAVALRDRVERLIGHSVRIEGSVFPATTGYDLTDIMLRVEAIAPLDPTGEKALLAPKVEFHPRDVKAYDVTVNAGRRLAIHAQETESGVSLVPTDQYVTHWMTGAGVLYVNCRDGYDLQLISVTPVDGAICFGEPLPLQCGLSGFRLHPIVLHVRCTKRR